jgi:AraC family transcriptional regulator of adaptative response / DNA-3-methyladenine glycosylase II
VAAGDGELGLVNLGIQFIVDGGIAIDNGVHLATRLGVTHRQLRRLFQTYAGITPDQLARSRRAHLALSMLDDTSLPVSDIVFASGFGSIRQFNRTMYDVFRVTPLALRARRRRADRTVADGGLVVRLGSCTGLDWETNIAYLATQAIAGVDGIDRATYRRAVLIDGDIGALEIRRDRSGVVLMRALLPDWHDLLEVIQQARRIFNLGRHLETADNVLDLTPEMHIPGAWDPFEVGICAILGQGRDAADASAIAMRIVERYGVPAPGLSDWGLTHTFPAAVVLARAQLDGIGLTTSETTALKTFADAVMDGDMRTNRCAPLGDAVVAALLATPGVDRMTVDYVAMRVGAREEVMPDRRAPQGGLRQLLGQRRSQTIRLRNSDTQSRKWESPIGTSSY